MKTTHQTESDTFYTTLKTLAELKKYVGIKYFTNFRELVSTSAVIKAVIQGDEAGYVQLNTGEEIRLDQLVWVDGQNAPDYGHLDFTCDCNQ